MSFTRIGVGGERPYEVVVGHGAAGELPSLMGADVRTVVVIHPAGLGELARPVLSALRRAGYQVHAEPSPDGEAAKDIVVAAGLWSRLAAHRLTRSDAIVGLGGGAVLDPGTQRLLAGLPVVYLATGFAAAAKRVGMDRPRPLLAGNPRAMLRALLERRLPVYEKLASITVSTDDRAPEEIAAEIADHLPGSSR